MGRWDKRERMRASAAPFLDPDEVIQQVIGAQTGNPHVPSIGLVLTLFTAQVVRVGPVWWLAPAIILATHYAILAALTRRYRYRMIVATHRRLLVLDTGHRSTTKARSVLAELDRRTVLGPAAGFLWDTVELCDETVWISSSYFGDIERADYAVSHPEKYEERFGAGVDHQTWE